MRTIKLKNIGLILFFLAVSWLILSYYLQKQLITTYQSWQSPIILDRDGKEIYIKENPRGYLARYAENMPDNFKNLLLEKEDKYFYYHFGLNPVSLLRQRGASTITQQLAKILLDNENKRNLKNKITELVYALSLETYRSKNEILKMYANSIYLGSKTQGFNQAALFYFGVSPDFLTSGQIRQLLNTINNPTNANPQKIGAAKLAIKNADPSSFEINSLFSDLNKPGPQKITIDRELNEKIREMLKRNIDELRSKNVQNGSVVALKLPEVEMLSAIGSADPESFESGNQLNMLKEPRPIGSTVKPFIYLKAFEKNARPYTLVDDREYKYITALGFPLYPKNFDFQYRGIIPLHYALSNSLNVPAVKVLEYVGLENFYSFLENDLKFKPIQPLPSYQLGIALGSLEMNILDLAKYFTIFPSGASGHVQLVNKILSDRKTGIEQFGMRSDLNLFQSNYALKTGTSRDFKDSWVVGYTPDFLVAVWLGNHDNSSMDQVSGQIGAGRVFAEVMNLLFNSAYNKNTPFEFGQIKEFNESENIEYGLRNDNYLKMKNILIEEALILNPHDGDSFVFDQNAKIELRASKTAEWFVNDKFLGAAQELIFQPTKSGIIEIKAKTKDSQETINIYFISM